jgi:hypothetical protein
MNHITIVLMGRERKERKKRKGKERVLTPEMTKFPQQKISFS